MMNIQHHNLMETLSQTFYTRRGDVRKHQNRSYEETKKLGLDMYYDWYLGELDYISNHSTEYFERDYYNKSYRMMQRIIDEASLHNTVPINITANWPELTRLMEQERRAALAEKRK